MRYMIIDLFLQIVQDFFPALIQTQQLFVIFYVYGIKFHGQRTGGNPYRPVQVLGDYMPERIGLKIAAIQIEANNRRRPALLKGYDPAGFFAGGEELDSRASSHRDA